MNNRNDRPAPGTWAQLPNAIVPVLQTISAPALKVFIAILVKSRWRDGKRTLCMRDAPPPPKDGEEPDVRESMTTLTGLAERTLRAARKELARLGLVNVSEAGNGRGLWTLYAVNFDTQEKAAQPCRLSEPKAARPCRQGGTTGPKRRHGDAATRRREEEETAAHGLTAAAAVSIGFQENMKALAAIGVNGPKQTQLAERTNLTPALIKKTHEKLSGRARSPGLVIRELEAVDAAAAAAEEKKFAAREQHERQEREKREAAERREEAERQDRETFGALSDDRKRELLAAHAASLVDPNGYWAKKYRELPLDSAPAYGQIMHQLKREAGHV